MHQQALCVDEDMPLFAFDLLAAIKARRIDPMPPFSALLTLWLSMRRKPPAPLALRCGDGDALRRPPILASQPQQ
jgi:hypothetical protein